MNARTTQELQAQLMVIALRRHLNQAQRRRFWRGMRAALHRHSLVVGQFAGLSAVMAVGRPLGPEDRRLVLNWLVDQPSVRAVDILPRKSLAFFRHPELDVGFDGREADAEEREGLRRLIRNLLEVALCHYLVALRQANASLEALDHG